MTTRPMRSAKRLASYCLSALFFLHATACVDNRQPVAIKFTAEWNGSLLGCDSPQIALTDLRFFVSNVVLTDRKGNTQRLELQDDSLWQQGSVALIDLENGSSRCQNGTKETHRSLTGLASGTDFVSLQFTVGVPFTLNHANPLLADAPLDDGAMHWHWRSGYKFLRAGIASETDSVWLHLGSTGCEGTVGNISSCRSPNRITVNLTGFSPVDDHVVVDLSRLFEDADLGDDAASNCSSSPADATCAGPFDALGLAFNGEEDAHEQRVFRVSE